MRTSCPPKQETVRLSHVFVGVRPSEETIEHAQSTLDTVRERLDAGEEFSAIARELSDDAMTRDSGGDLGWFGRGTLDPTFEDVAFSLGAGETSEPFQTALGVELVHVIERDAAGERVHVQHILVRLGATGADRARAQETGEKVRALALSGTSFQVLVNTYSDDRDSADLGGDLGQFVTNDLVPFVAGAVEDLGVGDISDVVEAEQGFHVFKVTERAAGGDYTLAEISGQLRNTIGEERAAALTEEWLLEIRGNYFVRRASSPPVVPAAAPSPGVRLNTSSKSGS